MAGGTWLHGPSPFSRPYSQGLKLFSSAMIFAVPASKSCRHCSGESPRRRWFEISNTAHGNLVVATQRMELRAAAAPGQVDVKAGAQQAGIYGFDIGIVLHGNNPQVVFFVYPDLQRLCRVGKHTPAPRPGPLRLARPSETARPVASGACAARSGTKTRPRGNRPLRGACSSHRLH